MAVSITDPNYDNMLSIYKSIDRFNYQLDPCFAAFKRIDRIIERKDNSNNLISNLQQADRESIRSELMWI